MAGLNEFVKAYWAKRAAQGASKQPLVVGGGGGGGNGGNIVVATGQGGGKNLPVAPKKVYDTERFAVPPVLYRPDIGTGKIKKPIVKYDGDGKAMTFNKKTGTYEPLNYKPDFGKGLGGPNLADVAVALAGGTVGSMMMGDGDDELGPLTDDDIVNTTSGNTPWELGDFDESDIVNATDQDGFTDDDDAIMGVPGAIEQKMAQAIKDVDVDTGVTNVKPGISSDPGYVDGYRSAPLAATVDPLNLFGNKNGYNPFSNKERQANGQDRLSFTDFFKSGVGTGSRPVKQQVRRQATPSSKALRQLRGMDVSDF